MKMAMNNKRHAIKPLRSFVTVTWNCIAKIDVVALLLKALLLHSQCQFQAKVLFTILRGKKKTVIIGIGFRIRL